MAEGGLPTVDEKLNCSICLECFKKPKLLPCYHTFCTFCLDGYVNRTSRNNKFECPLCRKTIEVPNGGVENFQSNFYIGTTSYSEKEDESIPCDSCGPENRADHRCMDCSENFCSVCTKAHMNMKISRHHTLTELKSADTNVKKKLKSRAFCSKHPNQELLVICKSCDQLLCVLCTITGHKDHDTREIAEEAAKVRKELALKIDGDLLNQGLLKLQQDIVDCKQMTTKFNEDLSSELKAVQDHGKSLQEAIKIKVLEMEMKLKDAYQMELKAVTEKIQELQSFYQSISGMKQMALGVVERENDIGIIEKGQKLCEEISIETNKQTSMRNTNASKENFAVFRSGQIDGDTVQQLVGNIELQPPPLKINTTDNTLIRLIDGSKQIATFTVEKLRDKNIYSIAPTWHDKAWIFGIWYAKFWYSYERDLYLVDKTGKELKHHTMSTPVWSLFVDDDGNCIVSCPVDKSIRRITVAGKEEVLVSGLQSTPRCAVIRKGRWTNHGRDEILLSCDSGTVLTVPYQMAQQKTSILSGYNCSGRLATDSSNGNICISDCRSKTVHILDKTGREIGQYKDDTGNFRPFGVCFDSHGYVLCVDENQSHVRRLKQNGSLVEILFSNKCKGLRSVAANKNKIWLGGGNGQVCVYEIS